MIGFISGKVVAYGNDFVLLDHKGIGFRINFYRPEVLKVNEEITIYTYMNVREDEISLYGFLSLEDYDLFIKLIGVKGLGPKTAATIIAYGEREKIIIAIENSDTAFIKSLPGIGAKTASQIILDLKGKLVTAEVKGEEKLSPKLNDVIGALKNLGYKQSEITPVINKIKDEDLSIDEYIRKALKLLLKNR